MIFERIYGRNGARRTLYLLRVRLTPSTRWGGLYLHIFFRGDLDKEPHDHPWNFWTFPLTPYHEEVYNTTSGEFKTRIVQAWRIHPRRAMFTHRVLAPAHGGRIVTLVWHGPKVRRWGFWVEGRWVHWKEYVYATPH